MSLSYFLENISVYSVFIPIISGTIFFNRNELNAKIILLMMIFASVSQLAFVINYAHRYIFYNSYSLVDCLLSAFIFYKNIDSVTIKKLVIITTILQVCLWSYLLGFNGFNDKLFNEMICVNSLVQVVWVMFFFYTRYKSEKVLQLEKESIFWYSMGLLIYAPCTYFLFVFYNEIHGKKQYIGLWNLHGVINALLYLLIAIGLIVNKKYNSQIENYPA